MPHDREGKELKIGDFVYVPCTVIAIQETDTYCNISLETVEAMPPTDTKSYMSLNTRQVEKK